MEFTPEIIKEYHRQPKKRHVYYDATVERYRDLDIHFNGKYPTKLIEERRPAESAEIRDYRKKLFKPITKGTTNSVYNSFLKIYRSDEWSLKFDPTKVPTLIVDVETPVNYLTSNLPFYGSISFWAFNMALKKMLYDPNAWVLTMPLNKEKLDNEYYTPVPMIIHSDNVLDYELNEWVLIRSEERSIYKSQGMTLSGTVYLVVTKNEIIRYEERNGRESFVETEVFVHGLGRLPAHMIGGIIDSMTTKAMLWDSRISPMLPYLDEALREYNDLQAVVVQHANPKFWMYEAQDCSKCRGLGEVKNTEGVSVKCSACGGKGAAAVNPFDITMVRPSGAGNEPAPTPPMGYVTLDQAFIETQDKRIYNHVYNALATLNLQYLAQTPNQNSGVAKEIDKDELKTLFFAVGEDIVRIIDLVIEDILYYRYKDIAGFNYEDLEPYVAVPTRLNTVTDTMMMADLQAAKSSGLSQEIIKSKYLAMIGITYANEEGMKAIASEKIIMDNLSGLSDDAINLGLQMGSIDKIDAIIHYNISLLVDQALDLYPNYLTRTQMERYAILRDLASRKVVVEVRTPTRMEQQAAATTPMEQEVEDDAADEVEDELEQEDNNG